MYQVETRIADIEIVREGSYALRKVTTVAYENIYDFLGGIGEVKTYHDDRTLE